MQPDSTMLHPEMHPGGVWSRGISASPSPGASSRTGTNFAPNVYVLGEKMGHVGQLPWGPSRADAAAAAGAALGR